MSHDEMLDLPQGTLARSGKPEGAGQAEERKLTEGQVDRIVDGGVHVAAEIMAIGRALVDLAKIRVQADADIGRIDAETERLRVDLVGQVALRQEDRAELRDRGRVVADVIAAVTQAIRVIPDTEPSSRRAAIDMLPALVTAAVGQSTG